MPGSGNDRYPVKPVGQSAIASKASLEARAAWPTVGLDPSAVQIMTPAIFFCFGYHGHSDPANKPSVKLENTMTKKPAKATLTTAMIEEQTAAFLKAGGTVEYVGKGKSGQFSSAGSKQIDLKAGR